MFCQRDQLIKQHCGPTLTKYMGFVQHFSQYIAKVQAAPWPEIIAYVVCISDSLRVTKSR